MNYFAHGRHYLDDPYMVAGTAIPDWLNVVNRRARVRRKQVQPDADHRDADVAAIARGILQHLYDDDWFHRTEAFARLSWQFTREIRDLVEDDDSLRPMFLGHVVVELLLDDVLIQQDPQQLELYYEAISQVDPARVTDQVARWTGKDVELLRVLIPRFVEERFLVDYATDEGLAYRLSQVLRRVDLPGLPDGFVSWLASARTAIMANWQALLDATRADAELTNPTAGPNDEGG